MARRKVSRKFRERSRKLEPAVMKMWFHVPVTDDVAGAPARNSYISLSQCASLANRKFFRAGLNWAVAGFDFFTGETGGTGTVGVSKVPTNWISRNSWVKSFHHWDELNKRALEDNDGVKAKFTDFKVFMDHEHAEHGVANNLLPIFPDTKANQGDSDIFFRGEWEMSTMVIPDTSQGATGGVKEREIIWLGANYQGNGASGLDSVSMIEGYANSRALPYTQDPNVPDDTISTDGAVPENWMSATDNEGTRQVEEVIADLVFDNNQAPYPFENDGVHLDTMYPGGANQAPAAQLVAFDNFTTTTVSGHIHIPGTNFYGGLVKLQTQPSGTGGYTQLLCCVTLVPGGHRGYLAEPMQDV